jgi:hypothetical protein
VGEQKNIEKKYWGAIDYGKRQLRGKGGGGAEGERSNERREK